jgi:hypothetical protein
VHRILYGTIAGLVAVVVSAAFCGAQESPADVLARVPSSGYSNVPAVRLLEDVSYDIQTGGIVVTRVHEVVWVRTTDGISQGASCSSSRGADLDSGSSRGV